MLGHRLPVFHIAYTQYIDENQENSGIHVIGGELKQL